MKYFCNTCGMLTDGEIREEKIFGSDSYSEYVICEHCHSDDLSEAEQCVRCGEYSPLINGGLCEECFDKTYMEFVDIMERMDDESPATVNRNDIVAAMAECFDSFYEKYRFLSMYKGVE